MDWTSMQPWFAETEAMTNRAASAISEDSTLAEVHYRTLVANQPSAMDVTIDAYHAFKHCASD